MTARAIPVLPCISLPETLRFYRALGFEVTHEQTRPNIYAATRRGTIDLHFMGIPKLDPDKAYSTCLVLVPEVEQLHAATAGVLRELYGKVPLTGVPRISRMRPGQSRFTLVDVTGNSLIFIRLDVPDDYDESRAGPATNTHLDKALRTAARLRDFRNDDAAAAKVLDKALRQIDRGAPFERARVLVARAEIALVTGDGARARSAREELDALPLAVAERAQLADEIAALDALIRT